MFTSIKDLDRAIASFAPGEHIEILLGLPRALTPEEVDTVKQKLASFGFVAEYGSTLDWNNALRMEITVPAPGIGFLSLAGNIILAVGAVGIVSFVGISITNAISRHFVPVLLITGAFFLLFKLIERRA